MGHQAKQKQAQRKAPARNGHGNGDTAGLASLRPVPLASARLALALGLASWWVLAAASRRTGLEATPRVEPQLGASWPVDRPHFGRLLAHNQTTAALPGGPK